MLRLVISSALVLALVTSGCGGSATSDAGESAPDGELIATGERLYQARCAACHGVDLRGTDLGPSHLSRVYEPSHHGDAAFLLAVQVGVRQHHWSFGDMQPIPGLTPEDVEAIVAYVRDQQRVHGFEPYPP